MENRSLKRAVLIALLAGWASRTFAKKSGETISGRILLALRPTAIAELASNRTVILVSGTNGKTSTSRFLKGLIEQLGTTATSASGSNLSWGVASALMKPTKYVVLEVDELHLPAMIAQTQPRAVLLLNLTRDQLHRMHEVKRVATKWKVAVEKHPQTEFVIDVDDPFLNYATLKASRVIRISFGGMRHPDGAVCPNCGDYMLWNDGMYSSECGLTNEKADRKYEANSAAERNAVLANITASLLGAPWKEIEPAVLERSITKQLHGVNAHIRLTKNPASWTEALKSVTSPSVILILNAREVDGIDTSWLYDVSFAVLQGRKVVVTGERALDLQYRLHVEGIEAERANNFDDAMSRFTSDSSVQVLSAYTAFFELSH